MFYFRILFLLFIVVPFVEIYLLIEIGSVIGAPWTILLVVLTAALGAWLVRLQGLAALGRLQASISQGGLPATEILEGVMLLVAGALLLTPGFFTDAIGFLVLTPPLRRRLAGSILRRGVVSVAGASGGDPFAARGSGAGRDPLEGEFRRMDDR
jgi:UPF0716 protein FxsA